MKRYYRLLLVFSITIIVGACTLESEADSDSSSETISGSYATMLTIGQHLYCINTSQITTYDISDPKNPVIINNQDVGFDIQSLYHYDGLLLIGSSNEMHIFQLDKDGIPMRKSRTDYNLNFINECILEPIVVKNDIAYVTISTRLISFCSSAIYNELRVYDIADTTHPTLLKTVNLVGPRGLAVGVGGLYVCDDTAGLKVFDLANPKSPILLQTLEGFQAYDCILRGDLLIVVCPDQLRQYKVLNDHTLEHLANIQI